MKKIIAFLLVVSLTAAIAIGGTLAYLTDRDSEANVFTVGDVNIGLDEVYEPDSELIPGQPVVKEPTITNEGPNDAWVWATVAVPMNLASVIDFNEQGAGWTWDNGTNVQIEGKDYVLYTVLYNEALENGEVTSELFKTVELDSTVDIDPNGQWHTVVGGTPTDLGWNSSNPNPVIYVSAYAIQKDGFDTVEAAYAAYNTQWGTSGTEYAAPAVAISSADELTAALAAGGNYVLANDLVLDADSTITIPAGKSTTLDLNGKKISGTADGTSNREMFLVKGDLTVTDGEISMDATVDQGWGAMSTIFDVTAGGVLNLDGVTAVNEGGTSMNFVVHLNNWGEVTLNVADSTLKAAYIPVRVFNSGNDMNNVTIEDTTLEGKYCFWVHNYTAADFGHSADKAAAHEALLNLDIFGNGNVFTNTGYAPVMFGFDDTVYYNANGEVIQ